MHYHLSIVAILSTLLLWTTTVVNRVVALQLPPGENPAVKDNHDNNLRPISARLFGELEELARVVDIAYCVGTTGIQKPFLCASRCQDFNHFKLITTWSTGILLSDSCGYLAVDHSRHTPRIILAFRGTYSLANMIIDLSTIPQKYVPYPPDDDDEGDDVDDEKDATGFLEQQQPGNLPPSTPLDSSSSDSKCLNCTVHAGFLYSWMETRKVILPHVKKLKKQYPNHRLTLVGHSLGGAVAALAALEFHHRGWDPQVTTFGEPRVGNDAWTKYIDARFNETLPDDDDDDDDVGGGTNFRRVTHVYDQVPLLPLQEWGYRMHAGEIFISKPTLPPSIADLHHCDGDADPRCIAGDRIFTSEEGGRRRRRMVWAEDLGRYEAQFLMTHRDYFHRLGLCVPGGDPSGRWPGPVVLDLMMMPEEI